MKHLLLTTIAAVLVVGCGESQQSTPAPEAKPEPPTAKAPDISIHDAAKKGNPEDVKLHDAAEKGNLEAVKQHLAAGTDVNAKDDDGWTPLHWAASYGQKEVAVLLIAKGADVNGKNDVGDTPLDYWAEMNTEGETADLLRKHGGKTAEELKAEGK